MKRRTRDRFRELERRIEELESRPLPALPTIYVQPPTYPIHPPNTIWPHWQVYPVTTCYSNTAGANVIPLYGVVVNNTAGAM